MKKQLAWHLVFAEVKVMLPKPYLNLPPGYGSGAGWGSIDGAGGTYDDFIGNGHGYGYKYGNANGQGFGVGWGYGTGASRGGGIAPHLTI